MDITLIPIWDEVLVLDQLEGDISADGVYDTAFCMPFPGYFTVTDVDGAFSIEVPEGVYQIAFFLEGYHHHSIDIEATENMALNIRLDALPEADSNVVFSVNDKVTSDPVEGAQIYIWPELRYEDIGILGYPSFKEIKGVTNDQGQFETDIFGGPYSYFIEKQGYRVFDGRFDVPRGIAFDSIGHMYVADMDNHRIKKYNPNGAFLPLEEERNRFL